MPNNRQIMFDSSPVALASIIYPFIFPLHLPGVELRPEQWGQSDETGTTVPCSCWWTELLPLALRSALSLTSSTTAANTNYGLLSTPISVTPRPYKRILLNLRNYPISVRDGVTQKQPNGNGHLWTLEKLTVRGLLSGGYHLCKSNLIVRLAPRNLSLWGLFVFFNKLSLDKSMIFILDSY